MAHMQMHQITSAPPATVIALLALVAQIQTASLARILPTSSFKKDVCQHVPTGTQKRALLKLAVFAQMLHLMDANHAFRHV